MIGLSDASLGFIFGGITNAKNLVLRRLDFR